MKEYYVSVQCEFRFWHHRRERLAVFVVAVVAAAAAFDSYETFANSVFEDLDNICIMRGNALEVVRDHFPSNKISRIFVNHPEPPERTMALVVNNRLAQQRPESNTKVLFRHSDPFSLA